MLSKALWGLINVKPKPLILSVPAASMLIELSVVQQVQTLECGRGARPVIHKLRVSR